jgi:predicted acetyltransferase
MDDGKKVGKLQLRHKLGKSDTMPDGFESNIYYEIEPEFQHKGHGKKILALGLLEARKIGLTEVRLTVLEDNIPSQKIIKANGGVLIDTQLHSVENSPVRLYEIKL